MSDNTNDYKNGYNCAVENTLKIINEKILEDYGSEESIYSLLLSLKEELLLRCFK